MKLPSLSFLADAFVMACRRFPATMLCAIVGMSAIMSAIEDNGGDNLIKLWLMAQLGLALCTGLTAFAESRAWAPKFNWLLQAGGLLLLAGYYFWIDLDAPAAGIIHLPRYFALLAAAHLFVAFAPYLNRLAVADFWEYNKQLFANLVIGAAYTLILFAGLALALMAVNELFNLRIDEKMYVHLFVVLAAIFNTTFFLHHFPAIFEFSDREKAYNAVFKNLCQYILIPIVGLYFLILYAYSIKILVTWTLPHGWVSLLVLGFSVAGIFTYLINFLLPNYTDSQIVQVYRRWFWWVLLPMVGLLFVAIGRRISDYGITEERYYVAHAGVWLLAVCAYFLWAKTDNIKFIPISLAAFILVAMMGPLSAFDVARRNQTGILRRFLEENGRFHNGKLQPGATSLTGEAADRIQGCLEFLDRRDALGKVESWLPVPLDSLPGMDSTAHYSDAGRLAEWLNVKPGSATPSRPTEISIYSEAARQISAAEIGGFRSFYALELYVPAQDKHLPSRVGFSSSGTGLALYDKADKTVVDSFELRPYLRQWADSSAQGYYKLHPGGEILNLKGQKGSARLYLLDLRYNAKTYAIEYLHGYLFLK